VDRIDATGLGLCFSFGLRVGAIEKFKPGMFITLEAEAVILDHRWHYLGQIVYPQHIVCKINIKFAEVSTILHGSIVLQEEIVAPLG